MQNYTLDVSPILPPQHLFYPPHFPILRVYTVPGIVLLKISKSWEIIINKLDIFLPLRNSFSKGGTDKMKHRKIKQLKFIIISVKEKLKN